MSRRFDAQAQALESLLPRDPRIVIIGSTSFWHAESERTCSEVGRLLAAIPQLVLITGGVEGVGESVGRSFFNTRRNACQVPQVFHILPVGEATWDYGETLFAGTDMEERREILARMSAIFLAVEGGPGTVHEAAVACARNAVLLPVGRSGGHSAELHRQISRPRAVDAQTWAVLGANASSPEETAMAIHRAVQSCLQVNEQ